MTFRRSWPARVVVDWDHTCWDGNKLMPGAAAALDQLALHLEVEIFSCSVTTHGRYREVRDILDKADLHHVLVRPPAATGKPHATVYVDDRALQYTGDWAATLAETERRINAYRGIR